MCLGPQKDHRPQTWWVREGLQYLKDPSRFLNKGSRLPIPGLYPLISHAMKHPQKAPASFHTDQHPPKHFFFHFSFSLDYPCSLSLYVKLLLSLQEPQKHHLLPEAFLDFFTARSLFSLVAMLTPLLLLELWLDSEPFSFGDFSSVQFSHSLMSDSL